MPSIIHLRIRLPIHRPPCFREYPTRPWPRPPSASFTFIRPYHVTRSPGRCFLSRHKNGSPFRFQRSPLRPACPFTSVSADHSNDCSYASSPLYVSRLDNIFVLATIGIFANLCNHSTPFFLPSTMTVTGSRTLYTLDLDDTMAFPDNNHIPAHPPAPDERWVIITELVSIVLGNNRASNSVKAVI